MKNSAQKQNYIILNLLLDEALAIILSFILILVVYNRKLSDSK